MEEQKENKQRKQRSDAGQQLLTERDLWLLSWIGDMWAVQRDQLERLLARRPKRPDKLAHQNATTISSRTITPRWEKLGLVVSRKILVDRPAWIWLTRKGLEAVGQPYIYVEPTPGKLQHYYWCNQVRLYVEGKPSFKQENRVWISERGLKQGREGRKRWNEHPTDGVVVSVDNPQDEIAVEVEVTAKSKERTLDILKSLLTRYAFCWYFVSPEARNVVQWAIDQQSDVGRSQVAIFDIRNTE